MAQGKRTLVCNLCGAEVNTEASSRGDWQTHLRSKEHRRKIRIMMVMDKLQVPRKR